MCNGGIEMNNIKGKINKIATVTSIIGASLGAYKIGYETASKDKQVQIESLELKLTGERETGRMEILLDLPGWKGGDTGGLYWQKIPYSQSEKDQILYLLEKLDSERAKIFKAINY
jgi:hypothetical protein